jgi:hypothetical protein
MGKYISWMIFLYNHFQNWLSRLLWHGLHSTQLWWAANMDGFAWELVIRWAWVWVALLALSCHWLGPSHMTTPDCTGGWDTYSSWGPRKKRTWNFLSILHFWHGALSIFRVPQCPLELLGLCVLPPTVIGMIVPTFSCTVFTNNIIETAVWLFWLASVFVTKNSLGVWIG